MQTIKTQTKIIADFAPTYIIAEIGSNFDGSLKKAKQMVDLACEVGADCAKFQSFLPEKIISKRGFEGKGTSFQSSWNKSVYDIYKDAVFPREWHREVAKYCKKKNIDFNSTPYDKEAVDLLESIGVPYFKIGSGEVTNLDFIAYIAAKGKPLLLGTGACMMGEIEEAIDVIKKQGNNNFVLMQCVTNYPSPIEDANIRVLTTFQSAFAVLVGYSDHTLGITVPLSAVTLGAKVIEKHFTDNKNNDGPDHPFALDPDEFSTMVTEIRNLEKALGSGRKAIYPSEQETKILQRRSLYTNKAVAKGQKITSDIIVALRPEKGVLPKFKNLFVGKVAQKSLPKDSPIEWDLITQK